MTAEPQTPDPAANRTAADVWTVKRILDSTTEYLTRHGSESPRLDAEVLLAHCRGCARIELYTRFNDVLPDGERAKMRELVRRRAQAEPVAYLVGRREFYSLDFRVTPDVLIPRPDTETLVMELLTLAKPWEAPRILDVGAGSGCIAIAIAKNHPAAVVTAIDQSEAALAVARENAETHGVSERIRFLHGDLFAPLEADDRFDFVASNPPYIRDDEMTRLQPDVRLHEPRAALAAGPDGLNVIRRLIADSPARLGSGGRLFLEIDSAQRDVVCRWFCEDSSYEEPVQYRDASGKPRVVAARLASN